MDPSIWAVVGQWTTAVPHVGGTGQVPAGTHRRRGPALQSEAGVQQGCPLSPTLFGFLADGLHRSLQATAAASGVLLDSGLHIFFTDLGYADDFALVSSSVQGCNTLSVAQQRGAQLWGCSPVKTRRSSRR